MTPIPEEGVGWEDPEPEPEPDDEDLGAGLNGRLGTANVLTGILTVDTVDRSQRSRYVNRSKHCNKHKMFVVSWLTSKWSTPLSQILSYLLAEKHPTSPEHLKHLSDKIISLFYVAW